MSIQYKIVDTGGSGNCLFSSLGYFLDKSHEIVRSEIIEKIRKDCKTIRIAGKKLCCLINISERMKVQDYCNRMQLLGVCGGEIELFVASILYNLTIEVYDQNFKLKYTYPSSSKNEKIIRILYSSSHYQVLIEP